MHGTVGVSTARRKAGARGVYISNVKKRLDVVLVYVAELRFDKRRRSKVSGSRVTQIIKTIKQKHVSFSNNRGIKDDSLALPCSAQIRKRRPIPNRGSDFADVFGINPGTFQMAMTFQL